MSDTNDMRLDNNIDSMIQKTYDNVPLKTLLKGYRKRIIELLDRNNNVTPQLKGSLRYDADIIVECSSRGSAVKNINLLRGMWANLLNLTKYICEQLKKEDELSAIGGDTQTTIDICDDVIKLADGVNDYLTKNNIPAKEINENTTNNETPIIKYIKGLDALFPYSDKAQNDKVIWKNVVTYGIFKQIYTQVYCTICDYNRYARDSGASGKEKFTKKIVTTTDDNHAFTTRTYTSAKDVIGKIGKAKNIASWIDSRWDWRIPICCIDKMIVVIDNTKNKLSADLYKYVPSIIYFSRKCKSSPTAYISNIDFVEFIIEGGDVMFLRCSKSIKQSGIGYYIDLVTSYRKLNFSNLSKYNSMSKEVWSHMIIFKELCYTPDEFLKKLHNDQDTNKLTIVKK